MPEELSLNNTTWKKYSTYFSFRQS